MKARGWPDPPSEYCPTIEGAIMSLWLRPRGGVHSITSGSQQAQQTLRSRDHLISASEQY